MVLCTAITISAEFIQVNGSLFMLQVQEERSRRALFIRDRVQQVFAARMCMCVCNARVCGDPSLKKTRTSIVLGMKFSREPSVEQPLNRVLSRGNDLLRSHIVFSSRSKDLVDARRRKKRRRRDEPVAFTMTKIELCRRERKARRTRPCTGVAAARLWFPHYHSDFRGDGGSGERKRNERERERERD